MILLQHRLRVFEQLARGRPLRLVFEDLRIAALQFPGLEERRPVDVAGELGKIPVLEHLHAEEGRLRRLVARPVDPVRVGPRLGQRQPLLVRFRAGMRVGDLRGIRPARVST